MQPRMHLGIFILIVLFRKMLSDPGRPEFQDAFLRDGEDHVLLWRVRVPIDHGLMPAHGVDGQYQMRRLIR